MDPGLRRDDEVCEPVRGRAGFYVSTVGGDDG